MSGYRSHHATIFLPPEAATPIEAARRQWDPLMAAQIAAHVTLIYPQEAPVVDLLVDRLGEASVNVPPFRLRLGQLACHKSPELGVYIRAEDVDGGYRAMRARVLRPPFQRASVTPHVTLVHPRTSGRGREFWDTGRYQPRPDEFTVRDVTVTAFDGARWVVCTRFVQGSGGGAGDGAHIERLASLVPDAVSPLVAESEAAGLRFVRRLVEEWTSGANRFDRPGEALFAATRSGRVVGVCGLNVDPYATADGVGRVGRVRHLYVLSAHRGLGIGRRLVGAVIAEARGRFHDLRLRTENPAAARLYEGLGFQRCADIAACTHRMPVGRQTSTGVSDRAPHSLHEPS
jgi:ribosomal protein S18 acetylase RimI-like enzyme